MAEPAATFDTLAYSQELRKVGIAQEQADAYTKAQVNVISSMINEHLVTKSEFNEFKSEFHKLAFKVDKLDYKTDKLELKIDQLALKMNQLSGSIILKLGAFLAAITAIEKIISYFWF